MSFTINNRRFGKDLQQRFAIVTPPTTTVEGLPYGLDPNASPHSYSYTIDLEDREIGKGRLGRVFRGVMTRHAPTDSTTATSTSTAASSYSSLTLNSSSGVYTGPGLIERVVVKLVAPLAKIRMQDGARHSIYHHSQRTKENVQTLISEIEHEALQYAQFLPALQGTVVPRFFGHGVATESQAAIMVLEDAGQALSFPYQRLPDEDRQVFLKKALHKSSLLTHIILTDSFCCATKSSFTEQASPTGTSPLETL